MMYNTPVTPAGVMGSEWQRSIADEGVMSPRKISGTATGGGTSPQKRIDNKGNDLYNRQVDICTPAGVMGSDPSAA